MIDSDEISVVVQGNIYEESYTSHTLKSVRRMLPKAEIILSTWNNSRTEGLDYDKLVLSEDPGHNIDNINRQICNTVAGIRAASHKYILKIRSESVIKGIDFIKVFDAFPLHGREMHFLKNRIVICGATPSRTDNWFHIIDWYFFGLKEDILDFWNLPYCDDSQIYKGADALYFDAHRYLLVSFIQKYYPLRYAAYPDNTEENRIIYEKIMAENFIILEQDKYGIESLKYPYTFEQKPWNRILQVYYNFTFHEWKQLYNKYCGGKLKIKYSLREQFGIRYYTPVRNLRNRLARNRLRNNRC